MNESPTKLMARKRGKPRVFFAALLGIYFGLIVLSDDSYRLDENCEATGWHTSVVAAIKTEKFWRNQLKHIDSSIAEWRATVPNILRAKQESHEFAANMELPEILEQIYQENPQLRPSPAQQYANALRRNADAIEEAATLRVLALQTSAKVVKAMACRRIVLDHVRQVP